MESFWVDLLDQAPAVLAILIMARLSLLVSWPVFLLLEKWRPASTPVPASNYWLNWQITLINVILSPVFTLLVIVLTAYAVQALGFPSLELTTATVSVGIPAIDLLLQGALIFLVACLLGDFSYYWWHRLQHTVPFLWEIHKLHHSDENLNTTTIYRSHFLEPTGQALFRGLTIGLNFDTSQTEQTMLVIVSGGLLPVLWDYFIHASVRIDALHRLLPFFSNPQFHWIHHSRLPQHQDKNFAIWIPLYDIVFGSYYAPELDEYPPTGLSSGEKIDSLWRGQFDPLFAWAKMLRRGR